MKKLRNKKWLYSLGGIVTSFALMVTAFNVNSTCVWTFGQEELPKSAKKLRKF